MNVNNKDQHMMLYSIVELMSQKKTVTECLAGGFQEVGPENSMQNSKCSLVTRRHLQLFKIFSILNVKL